MRPGVVSVWQVERVSERRRDLLVAEWARVEAVLTPQAWIRGHRIQGDVGDDDTMPVRRRANAVVQRLKARPGGGPSGSLR